MSTLPPCVGKWELFDSIDPFDHLRAADLCATCPMLDACNRRLEVARNNAHGNTKDYGPVGTWAGRLVGVGPKTSVERAAAEEAMFTADELLSGHAAWNAGERDDRSRMAERIYQRKRARRRYAAQKASAA